MPATQHELTAVDRDGFAIVEPLLSASQIGALLTALCIVDSTTAGYGVRNLLSRVSAVNDLAHSPPLSDFATTVLQSPARPVRGILFDKTPYSNWKVAWHQDLSIAVKQRIEVPAFGPWSVKEGVAHVQPPVEVLERMVTLRLHLDPCDEQNGPLRVIAGSHRAGVLDAAAIQRWRAERPVTACCVPAGGVLIMRPLLLHASSAADAPRHRRVVHIEYAGVDLPGGLEWHAA